MRNKKWLDINTNYLVQIQNKFLNSYNAHNTKQFMSATFKLQTLRFPYSTPKMLHHSPNNAALVPVPQVPDVSSVPEDLEPHTRADYNTAAAHSQSAADSPRTASPELSSLVKTHSQTRHHSLLSPCLHLQLQEQLGERCGVVWIGFLFGGL
jgi:hypothetical protein